MKLFQFLQIIRTLITNFDIKICPTNCCIPINFCNFVNIPIGYNSCVLNNLQNNGFYTYPFLLDDILCNIDYVLDLFTSDFTNFFDGLEYKSNI